MWNLGTTQDGLGYAGLFAGNFSFLLSIIIGIIATYFVFQVASKMGGGLFGSVLWFVGYGMVLIVLGSISIALEPWVPEVWIQITHTVFFALGFVFLAVGANKLLRGINNY